MEQTVSFSFPNSIRCSRLEGMGNSFLCVSTRLPFLFAYPQHAQGLRLSSFSHHPPLTPRLSSPTQPLYSAIGSEVLYRQVQLALMHIIPKTTKTKQTASANFSTDTCMVNKIHVYSFHHIQAKFDYHTSTRTRRIH